MNRNKNLSAKRQNMNVMPTGLNKYEKFVKNYWFTKKLCKFDTIDKLAQNQICKVYLVGQFHNQENACASYH